ncbi:MAG: SDR family NAD(P)-dependent oxidoreductase [Gammaproteobacteria bacterium]|nr:SDR family NAD(P)-dependent oxidoreductase [Gammaproteobacteria bacterium]MYG67798.1 SDR family NAD(P)-dependent oxidoreductase [Gammaproteobacteria bacterium]
MKNTRKNKGTALVTGASSGIGKATAEALVKDDYIVYGAARRVEMMDDLKQLGGIPVKMDVTKDKDLVSVVEQIKRDHGGVDILVNNAGLSLYGSVEEAPFDKARHQFDVNFFGQGRLTQLVLPHMREQRWGKIVNVSSGEGKVHAPLAAWYVASKFALEGFSDCLRAEMAQFNIDVVVIEPGAIDTPITDGFIDPLLEYSGSGPYGIIAHKMADWFRNMSTEKGTASPPTLIGETILQAIKATRPKTRYAAGAGVRRAIFFRRWFSDRMFDRFMMRMLG